MSKKNFKHSFFPLLLLYLFTFEGPSWYLYGAMHKSTSREGPCHSVAMLNPCRVKGYLTTCVVPQAVDPIDTYASCITWQTESSFGSQHALKRSAHAKLRFGGKTILDPVSGSVWSFLDLLQSIVINVRVSH